MLLWSAPKPIPVLLVPVVLLLQGLKAIGRVIVSAGIAKQGLPARRGIAVTGEVGRQSLITVGCVVAPCSYCCASAEEPIAVFWVPVVLSKSATAPTAVLSSAVVFCGARKYPWRCWHCR